MAFLVLVPHEILLGGSRAQTHLFHKLGRAMFRPTFLQRSCRIGKISKVLRTVLLCWLYVFRIGNLRATCLEAPGSTTCLRLR